MAGIQSGPYTFFRVGPGGAEPKSYALLRGQFEGRLNVEYYKTEVRDIVELLYRRFPNIKPISAYGEVVCGPFGSAIKMSDHVTDGVPLLRISNITGAGTLDYQDIIFVTHDKSSTLESTQVTPGDIVVSQRGTLGMSAVVSSEYSVLNISANLVAIRGLSGLNPRFVQLYLASTPGALQIKRFQSGQVHAKITTDDIASILIPNPANQDELVRKMNVARNQWETKIAQADALLAGSGDFVLDALGFAPPAQDSRRAFAVRLGQSRTEGRLNPDFYHPERFLFLQKLNNAKESMPVERLDSVANFIRQQIKAPSENYLSLAHVQSHTGELTEAMNRALGSCFTYQSGDVLFSRLRPYLNKVYRAETEGCCSTEFHVLRIKNREALLPEYLSSILRSRLTLVQTAHMTTGNTHPRLTNDDVANLQIPIPKMELQETIVAEVARRHEEARRLRVEAETGWQEAKQWFEEQLLGAAAP